MPLTFGVRVVVIATTAGVVAALAATAPASAGPDRPDGAAAAPAAKAGDTASSPLVAAMQRDLGLTEAQVRSRLTKEDAAARTDHHLKNTLGSAYAGAWLTAGAEKLIVAVTDARAATAVTTAGAQATVVARSVAQLDGVKAGLDKATKLAPRSIAGWHVDVTTNTVVVTTQDAAAGTRFVKASGVDSSAVKVVTSAESPRLLYDVRGGDAYYMGGRCSVGFSVSGGFVTAGHCGDPGTATQGFNRVAQGTFQGSSFPGNDYGWVRVNTNWTPVGVVNNYSGGTVAVAGSQEAVVGASICRSGSTTGWHCGTVQAKNQTVNYAEGSVSGLTRTNVCAEPGDSGGSWLSGSQAQGVTSGGSGNCTSGGTTYFQPVNEILQAYNLTLVTSGGGGPDPNPPTGCSGYESTYTGSLSGTGAQAFQPGGSYFQAPAGAHQACLDGPTGVDFDLYLQRWNGSAWATVASGTSANPDETLSYNGAAGYYRYRVHSYRGSGSYTLGVNRP